MGFQEIAEIAGLPLGGFILLIIFGVVAVKTLRDDSLRREQKLDETIAENKNESRLREEKLMNHIEITGNTFIGIGESLKGVDKSLANLNDRVDDLEKKIQ